MEFIRRSWAQIQDQAKGLPPNTLLVIGMALALLVTIAFVVVLYAGQPQRVPIGRLVGEADVDRAATALQSQGIDVHDEGGMLMVGKDDRSRAIVALQELGLLSADASAGFGELVKEVNPWMTSAQWDTRRDYAIKVELEHILAALGEVKSAQVMFSMPESQRFGVSAQGRGASVQVTTSGSFNERRLSEAVAALVSGALGIRSQEVQVVIDGKPVALPDEDTSVSSDLMESELQLEDRKRRQVTELLAHVPGVTVAVDVHLDAMRREVRTNQVFQDGSLLQTSSMETESYEPNRGAEPGIRGNQPSNAGTPVSRPSNREETSDETFSDALLTERSEKDLAGGMIRLVNVSVLVPRSYYVALWRAVNPDAGEEGPDPAALQVVVDEQNEAFRTIIEPLTQADTGGTGAYVPGMVRVQMAADASLMNQAESGVGLAGMFGGSALSVGAIGVPLLIAVATLFLMSRKIMVPVDLPSLEDLAGVPPTLPTDDELIGEVEEGESDMSGLLIDDALLESQKMAEQIAELIKTNPEEATQLIHKWVDEDQY